MPSCVIVGCQWGDEGKGKITDYYAEQADIIVRYQGGNNAGHTVVLGDEKYKFHLMPSGAVQGKELVLGNGMVIDPAVLINEINSLKNRCPQINLKISGSAHVIFPYHKMLDELEEQLKGALKAGTTKRGIGPAYEDKVSRFGIRMCDLLDEELLSEKLDLILQMKKDFFKCHGLEFPFNKDDLLKQYMEFGKYFQKNIVNTSILINKALDEGKKVIFEGAQGTLLGIDHGIYPYGTSSNTTAGGACTGAGVAPTRINRIIGVMKAYLSRVGEGPVPTELDNELGKKIREKGNEYGTTTGRPRRVGWLDLVAMKYSKIVNNFDGLAITKLDTLSGLGEIKACIAYKLDGKEITEMPLDPKKLARCIPIYKSFKGWQEEDWKAIARKGYDALPEEMREYLNFIKEYLDVEIYLISLGPRRDETIELKNIF
ncbi:MAG: adenylosuccinate synthase [Candidatus Helarchaeales archaeon]